MAGYVTTVVAFVRAKLRAREASSFCDFWKMTTISTHFTPFLLMQTVFLKDVLGNEYYS